ncbi:serine hydrolase domain-containing protein [Cohnella thailandensis]|uniref:Beta-lactamase family protein n=1 Tax=Cohnella thailandensis TaxID=557557 RepID=A0A841T0W1_9BACL|nr:serine hydrolase domain-containing protein [Cohnella thailandensis]MBB6637182.1 beta-lactamase family protein [Cohnella thailandensis]MBP1976997.1 CubicO group peptidase (beta-lactamase class C family) [Cohnella thailandensis]
MSHDRIDEQMLEYLANNDIAGASLLVRNDTGVLYRNKWGYANLEAAAPVEYDTIFRLASLTKPITAAAVLILVDQGKIGLDDEIVNFIPEFNDLMVCRTEFDLASLNDLAKVDLENIKLERAKRNVTIRDLLSHSSGLGMGVAGHLLAMKLSEPGDTLETRFRKFQALPADFEPGESTGYSAVVGFDALGRAIEVASGMSLERFLRENLFEPLEMNDTAFHINDHQQKRLAVLYKSENGDIFKAPDSEDIDAMVIGGPRYYSGAGGLYSTLSDYDRFAQMLLHEGEYKERRILKAETVRRIHREGAYKHLDFAPGMVWGLGMIVRKEPELAHSSLTKGSYGWSGAFGTHFFVDPVKKVSVVLMLNRSNIGGAGSYVSKRIEELVAAAYL